VQPLLKPICAGRTGGAIALLGALILLAPGPATAGKTTHPKNPPAAPAPVVAAPAPAPAPTPPAPGAKPGATPIAVLGLEGIEIPEDLSVRLTAALREALTHREAVQALPGKDLVEMRFLFGCTDEAALGPCLAQAGRSLGAARLLFGSIRPTTIGDQKTSAFFVRLRSLDVATGAISPVEVHETVMPDEVMLPKVEDTAAHFLAVLLGGAPPRPVAAPPRPVAVEKTGDEAPPQEKPGRRWIVGGIVAGSLALASFALAIGTWQTYLGDQESAHKQLGSLAMSYPDYASSHADFFGHPTCTVPDAKGLSVDQVNTYSNVCSSGQSYASATTGLIITGSVLGAFAITAVAVGVHAARAAKKQPAAAKSALGPSLVPSLGGFTLTF
jgi:hypothetical protein